MTSAPRDDDPLYHPASGVVGDYTLLAPLGEGGMGVVHLARRGATGERVALKLLRPHVVGDRETRARLEREVSSLSRVRSRWVAEIIDADPWAERPFIATRYVPGYSLHDQVLDEGPVAGRDLLWLARCLAEGLTAVHAAGVLHRDVKPSNVLMEGRSPILIDFGLARVADDPKITQTGWLLGTPGYLAPEIIYGEEPTTAVDVHAWAATVAYAATGRSPYGKGPSLAIMDRARRGEHDLTGCPDDLARVLDSALHPEPARRPTLEQLLAWLRPQTEPTLAPAPLETAPLAAVPLAPPPAPPRLDKTASVAPTRQEGEVPPPTLVERVLPTAVEPQPQRADSPLRRGLLLLTGGVAATTAAASVPWVTAVTLLVLVWLLRAGSLAASAARDKRSVRGRKWYDGPVLLLRTPWDLLRSVPGSLMLGTWSAGLTVAAGLLCYAVAAPLTASVALCGAVFVLGLWWGPYADRVRSPVRRAARPVSRDVRAWLVVMVVLLAVAGVSAWGAVDGPEWWPATEPPLAGMFS